MLPVQDGNEQEIQLVMRDESGAITRRVIGRSRFVPLIVEGTRGSGLSVV